MPIDILPIGRLVLFFEAQAWQPTSGSIFEYVRLENRPQRSQPGKLQTPLSGKSHPALASITLTSSPLARQGGAWRISSGPAGPDSPVSWRKASTTFWPTWPSRASMSAQRGSPLRRRRPARRPHRTRNTPGRAPRTLRDMGGRLQSHRASFRRV